jgi:hypothetical protein
MYTNTKDVLKFICNKIFTEIQLHEEYYLSLNKIFSTYEGRMAFLEIIERRFNPKNKVLLGKFSFQNLKDSLDLFLYEADKENEVDSVVGLIPYLDAFLMKSSGGGSGKENDSEGILKNKIRDHIIWKSDKIWKRMIEIYTEQIN